MKKNIKKIIIIIIIIGLIALAMITSLKEDKEDKDFINSIYVITENDSHDGVNYYEINNNGKIKEINNFNKDKQEKYIFNNCFISNIDIDSGKILNEYKEDTCKITDELNNTVTLDDTLKDIVNKTTNYVNQITNLTIYKVNNHYYPMISFKLSTHNSYKLYYYDTFNKKLKHIYTFNDKYVIGITEKDKLIFEEAQNDNS